jgi:hypothetical protein
MPPQSVTQSWRSGARMPRETRFDFVGNQSRKRCYAKIDTFKRICLCHSRSSASPSILKNLLIINSIIKCIPEKSPMIIRVIYFLKYKAYFFIPHEFSSVGRNVVLYVRVGFKLQISYLFILKVKFLITVLLYNK